MLLRAMEYSLEFFKSKAYSCVLRIQILHDFVSVQYSSIFLDSIHISLLLHYPSCIINLKKKILVLA